MKTTGVVTPTLMLGEPGSADHLEKATYVDNSSDAFTAIKSGLIAVLPPGAWTTAAEALVKLEAEEWVIQDRIHTAQTGQVLHAV